MKLIRLLSVFALFSMTAHAGFYVEPYLAYGFGSGDDKPATGTATTEDFSGPLFGARVGGSTLMLNYGLDYSIRPEFDMEFTTGATKTKSKYDASYLGLFIGVDFPVLVRAWASYYLDVTYEDKEGGDVGDEMNGKGFAVGAGFTGLPFISINAEYRMITVDEVKDVSAGTTTAENDHTTKEILLGVSIPLDF